MEFTVYARPHPQGSKTVMVTPQGRRNVVEQNAKQVKSWRGAVVESAQDAIWEEHDGHDQGKCPLPYSGPVALTVVFTLARPASHYGTGKNRGRLKPSAPLAPTGKNLGDLSKLVRATEDALTDAGVWGDDSQVVSLTAVKAYANTHQKSLHLPGAWISVIEIERGSA